MAEAPIAAADVLREDSLARLRVGVGLGGTCKDLTSLFEVFLVEEGSQPLVEAGHYRFLLDVNVSGMLSFSDPVLVREPAPVVGPVVVLLALHPAAADPAADETGEQVATAGERRGGRLLTLLEAFWASRNKSGWMIASWAGSPDQTHVSGWFHRILV